jgi:hypothetical protein
MTRKSQPHIAVSKFFLTLSILLEICSCHLAVLLPDPPPPTAPVPTLLGAALNPPEATDSEITTGPVRPISGAKQEEFDQIIADLFANQQEEKAEILFEQRAYRRLLDVVDSRAVRVIPLLIAQQEFERQLANLLNEEGENEIKEFLEKKWWAQVNFKLDFEGAYTLDGQMSYIDSATTPLHVAAAFNMKVLIPILLDHGADIYATDSNNQTPSMVAQQWEAEPPVIALLATASNKPVSLSF